MVEWWALVALWVYKWLLKPESLPFSEHSQCAVFEEGSSVCPDLGGACPFWPQVMPSFIPECGRAQQRCCIWSPQLPTCPTPISRECGSKSCWILTWVLYFPQDWIIHTLVLFGWQLYFSLLFPLSSPTSCSIYCRPRLYTYHVSGSKTVVFLKLHQRKGMLQLNTLWLKNIQKRCFQNLLKAAFWTYFMQFSISALGLWTAFL